MVRVTYTHCKKCSLIIQEPVAAGREIYAAIPLNSRALGERGSKFTVEKNGKIIGIFKSGTFIVKNNLPRLQRSYIETIFTDNLLINLQQCGLWFDSGWVQSKLD